MKTGRPEWDAALAGVELFGDEPVFIIRAQDEAGADAVRDYASRLRLAGAAPQMVDAVRRHAAEMDLWPVKKTPDVMMSDGEERQAAYEASRKRYNLMTEQPPPKFRAPKV